MLLGLSLFIFMKHHHFVTFPAVFQVLWLVSLDVSLDNEVNLMLVFGSALPGNNHLAFCNLSGFCCVMFQPNFIRLVVLF